MTYEILPRHRAYLCKPWSLREAKNSKFVKTQICFFPEGLLFETHPLREEAHESESMIQVANAL
jgi:hypothetical protein